MCDCITEVNTKLAEHNTCVSMPLIGRQQPFVMTEKVDEKKRGKVPLLFASCCPFCGEKYPEPNQLPPCKDLGIGMDDDPAEVLEELRQKLAAVTDECERLQVQLAGCSAAALGATQDPVKPGNYGWSQSYADVLALRLRAEKAEAERDRLAEALTNANMACDSIARKRNRLAVELRASRCPCPASGMEDESVAACVDENLCGCGNVLALAGLPAPSQAEQPTTGWQSIETAPRDGTHILVCFDQPFDLNWSFAQRPPTVAHWFGPADAPGLRSGGWYLSVSEMDQGRINPSHWQPLPAAPGAESHPSVIDEIAVERHRPYRKAD